MASKCEVRLQDRFQDAFRNRYVTEFSITVMVTSIVQLLIGIIGCMMMLWLILYMLLVALYLNTGIDLLGFRGEKINVTFGAVLESIVVFLVWLGFFAYLGPRNFIVLKRRLLDRIHVFLGRPLAFVEGPPAFFPDSESGFNGVEVDGLYFDFDDCLLEISDGDLEKLRQKEGVLRIWYIPTKKLRSWHHPLWNRRIHYNATLVCAEWKGMVGV